MKLKPLLFIVPGAMIGCAAPGPAIKTASGQPEITLHSVNVACVRSGFLNHAIDSGQRVKSSSENQMIFESDSKNFAANMLLSSSAGGSPKDRFTIIFVATQDEGIRIVLSEELVSNAGTGFERTLPITQNQNVQDQFEAAAFRLQSACKKI